MNEMGKGWFKPADKDGNLWDHGDHRDVTLYYVQNVFRQIVLQGNLE